MSFSYKRIYTFPRCGLASVLDNLKYQKGLTNVKYLRVNKLFDDSQIKSFKPDLILIRDCLDIFCSLWSKKPKSLPRENLSDFLIEMANKSTIPNFGDIEVMGPYQIAGEVKINCSDSFKFDRYYKYGLINDIAYETCLDFRDRFNKAVYLLPTKSVLEDHSSLS